MKGNWKNKTLGLTLSGAIALGSLGVSKNLESHASADNKRKKPTNVIMMVMDGTSAGTTTLSRWYKGQNLAIDSMASGAVRTYSAESAITDSAPAGTAMATGNKSNDKYIGILPSEVSSPGLKQIKTQDQQKPVANVLEGAKQAGKATGIIATSQIQHATPAAFSSHAVHRSLFGDIAEQQVYQNIDVVLGGGKEALLPGTEGDARKDGENMVNVIKGKKYDFVENRQDLMNSKSDKIWGSFSQDAMAYDFNRPVTRAEEPTLADMTKKAVSTLSKDKDGFFLFVEGSQVDWAAHANDPIGMVSETLAFDAAVKEAKEFARKDGNTLVIAVSDHGNSGITMGNVNTNSSYPNTPVSAYINPLKKAKMTVEGAVSQLKEDKSNIKEVAELYGLDNLTEEELNKLKESPKLGALMSDMLSKRANLGFTTGGHTGEDMTLYTYGPTRPTGVIENTDLALAMSRFMGFDLGKLSSNLFTGATDLFKKAGYTTEINKTDEFNPIFIAKKGKVEIKIPANKNEMWMNGKKTNLSGVAVFNGKDFYVPADAIKFR
ncbi:alkaline phosphatase [Peribacillus deserti]|uniref:Alkaline phosphatase n=1 Tax=Peribacillus deserti TaxID=673318 RepID=A0ABS2QLM3_9BACI|nr:alkaline phosphatase [Peribacillus deserti]MBM7694067.1 alkaline phosphatase [Peribacillus deserti]